MSTSLGLSETGNCESQKDSPCVNPEPYFSYLRVRQSYCFSPSESIDSPTNADDQGRADLDRNRISPASFGARNRGRRRNCAADLGRCDDVTEGIEQNLYNTDQKCNLQTSALN